MTVMIRSMASRFKLVTVNDEERVQCPPAEYGTIDHLRKEFVERQIREYQRTIDVLTGRLDEVEDVGDAERAAEYRSSLQGNIEKCEAKFAQYKEVLGLFT